MRRVIHYFLTLLVVAASNIYFFRTIFIFKVIDTPGILDSPLEERNTIEMQAVTALAHLRAAILFIMDISEMCDHTVEEQISLFQNIKPLFANKPILIGLNKTDVCKRSELAAEKAALIAKLEEESLSVFEMSTITQEGIMEFRNKVICEKYCFNRCFGFDLYC